ncbi:sensor histidine kinase [Streptomyces amakusaensis]|uniref:histidine kinase n=1 Tax=Streptomyces amakusaensis TaxID=67271 RepID=A0ABW0AEH7_9ACTN
MSPSPPPATSPKRPRPSAAALPPVREGIVVLPLLCLGVLEVALGEISSVPVLITLGAAVLPLPWRRTHPGPAGLAVAAALLNFLLRPELLLTVSLAGIAGLYALARRRAAHPVVVAGGAVAGALLVHGGHLVTGVYDTGPGGSALRAGAVLSSFAEPVVLSAVIVATVSAADAVRGREDARREREAARLRFTELERRGAVVAERAAIARELHDIVAHSVSVIAVRAESATYTTPGLSPEARDGFRQIAETARSTMTELRGLLLVLREEGERTEGAESGRSGATAGRRAPQPGLDALGELLETHRSAGGRVELRTAGVRPALSSSLELAVYRTVQEALTNARRHAPGCSVRVDVDYGEERVALRITDDGPGPPRRAERAGHGLIGMRERAALLGGRLRHGRDGGTGGFLIEAELPRRGTA